MSSDKLVGGNTSSCGCLRREVTAARSVTHGNTCGRTKGKPLSAEYTAWLSMKNRCNNPRTKSYADYGGRGIKVCEEWAASFATFLEDMGARPMLVRGQRSYYSVERLDNAKGYAPGNCKWATRIEQGRNRRNNRLITACGVTLCLSAWVERTGLSSETITRRIAQGVVGDAVVAPLG